MIERMRSMRISGRPRLTLIALALSGTLAGCETVEDLLESNQLSDAGYAKVPERTRDPIPRPSRPEPPPVVAGIGAGAAEVPVLAAAAAPPGVTQEMVEQGAELYARTCAACHGPGGTGTAAAPALHDTEWIHVSGAYEEIVNVIHTGVANPVQFQGAMPPLGGGSFDDAQVRAIAAYVFALSRAEGA